MSHRSSFTPSRRSVLLAGCAGALAAEFPAAAARAAAAPTATRVATLTGPQQTGQWGAALTDLGIPVKCPDGSMLFVCGDTFVGPSIGQGQWTAPAGLRSSSSDLASISIDSAVGGSHVQSMVPEGHAPVDGGHTTAIPSDAFTVGDTMYMHLMRGKIYATHHSELWKSTDNGNTWTHLCNWAPDLHRGNFQQKTYAVADDGYAYVYSGIFNRQPVSELLLHRVRLESLGDPAAYEPWGWDGSSWAWGNAPTTIATPRKWGEICLRVIDGKFAFSYFDASAGQIRIQVLPSAIGNLRTTPEQTLIRNGGSESGNVLPAPYGGWIFPGSTLDDLHVAVSQWIYPTPDYRVIHYKFSGIDAG
ncbi:DUF4185 domain-containing protein [Dermacoccaceae bacterium W4C1]